MRLWYTCRYQKRVESAFSAQYTGQLAAVPELQQQYSQYSQVSVKVNSFVVIKTLEQLQNTRPLHLHVLVCFEERGI